MKSIEPANDVMASRDPQLGLSRSLRLVRKNSRRCTLIRRRVM